MPNEFVARNGVIALNNSVITGSLNVTNGITGSLFGTASWASNATTASYVLNAVSASFATSASFASTSSFATTASYVLQAVSASFATSASQAQNATTASYVLNAVSASFASTASFIPTSSLTGNFFVQGGNSFGAQALLGTNDVQNLAFETSGSVRMTISGSNGNVGIGTTTPTSKLVVFGDNTAGVPALTLLKNVIGGTETIFDVKDGTNGGTTRFMVRADGNVGIGKTSPNSTLDVSGSATITGSLNVLGSITTTGTLTAQTLVVQTITSSTDFVTGSTRFGSLLANTHQFTGSVSMTGSLAVTGTGTISTSLTNPLLIGGTTTTSTITYQPTSGVGTTGADHIFKVGNNGATEAMRILNSGNVGIGTTTPGTKLEIQDAALDYTSALFNSQIITTTAQLIDRGGSLAFGGQTGTSAIQFGAVRGAKENSTSAETGGYLSFMTRANGGPITDKMRITSAGNVGIANTNPAYKLDVSGVIYGLNQIIANNTITDPTTNNTLSNGTVFSLNGVSTNNNFGMGLGAIRNSKYDIWFQTGGSNGGGYRWYIGTSEKMTIDATGNVGIGKTSPNATLDISGSLNISGSGVQIPLQVSSGSTSLLFVSQSGNVGIGTTSPAYKLDVSGSARVQSGLVAPLLFNRITTTYTLVLADQGKMIEANFSTNLVITVPLNLNVAFPIGTEMSFVMRNTGTVQIVGEVGFSSVTVNSAGGLNTISTQYGAASLVKVGADEWYLYGNLT